MNPAGDLGTKATPDTSNAAELEFRPKRKISEVGHWDVGSAALATTKQQVAQRPQLKIRY